MHCLVHNLGWPLHKLKIPISCNFKELRCLIKNAYFNHCIDRNLQLINKAYQIMQSNKKQTFKTNMYIGFACKNYIVAKNGVLWF